MVDLEERAAVSACSKRLPAGRAGPLQADRVVPVGKLQRKGTVQRSGELVKLANTLNISSQSDMVLEMDKDEQ